MIRLIETARAHQMGRMYSFDAHDNQRHLVCRRSLFYQYLQ